MVTTSSSKKKVKKGVHNGKHGDCWRNDRFDVSAQVSGDGKTPTGRCPEMSEDDDAITDEGDDGDDDMHQGQQSAMQTTLLCHIALPGWCSTAQ
jgi:hypothetical protein